MKPDRTELLKELPSVDQLVEMIIQSGTISGVSRKHLVTLSRQEIELARKKILDNENVKTPLLDSLKANVEKIVRELKTPAIKRVVNLSGVFVHTNLGRSPLTESTIEALKTASYYCNLEYDLSERKRGKRDRNLARILALITGCEHFLLANNNASCLFLVLNTFAKGKKVAVSRGELIEIGGSFRIPDIMRASGAKLLEVGTTNRTRLSDYKEAADNGAVMFLKVHTSNYQVQGFTETVDTCELVELAHSRNIMCVEDLGSGTFIDLGMRGLPKEPTVQDSLASGLDLVTFSVDKMLGGPQGGLILGKKEYIDMMNKNPIKRVVRAGKLTLLALEATLRGYLDEDSFINEHPLYRNLLIAKDKLVERAENFISELKKLLSDNVEYAIRDDKCYMGGGSLPERAIDTIVVELTPARISIKKLSDLFFDNETPIIGRISGNKLIFDMRQLEYTMDGIPQKGL